LEKEVGIGDRESIERERIIDKERELWTKRENTQKCG
jgi:hypothetical protein